MRFYRKNEFGTYLDMRNMATPPAKPVSWRNNHVLPDVDVGEDEDEAEESESSDTDGEDECIWDIDDEEDANFGFESEHSRGLEHSKNEKLRWDQAMEIPDNNTWLKNHDARVFVLFERELLRSKNLDTKTLLWTTDATSTLKCFYITERKTIYSDLNKA